MINHSTNNDFCQCGNGWCILSLRGKDIIPKNMLEHSYNETKWYWTEHLSVEQMCVCKQDVIQQEG